MTFKDVINKFVERYYTGVQKHTKAGNYECDQSGLYLFGNKIAWYESDKICTDYRGPYQNSVTTKKALGYLRRCMRVEEFNKSLICLFREED